MSAAPPPSSMMANGTATDAMTSPMVEMSCAENSSAKARSRSTASLLPDAASVMPWP